MSYIINLIVFLFFQISLIKSATTLKASKGLTDIFYNSTSQKLLFKIPVEEDPSINAITLNLSYPYRYNRSYCFADCVINRTISTNIFYDCTISKTDCDSLDGNKKIIIEEKIISPDNCEFQDPKTMVSVIYFEKTNIDMVCANYKLSFFVEDINLENHPYEDIYFQFPVYYKDKMETADCIFPKIGRKIACTIDASQRVFEKGYFVNFEYNKTIALTKDLNLTMELEKYVLEDDCGKDMNKGELISISFKICKYIIFLFLFFFI